MSKIFSLFLLFFLLFLNISNTFAEDKIRIYSRSEWGANEQYTYIVIQLFGKILSKIGSKIVFYGKKNGLTIFGKLKII